MARSGYQAPTKAILSEVQMRAAIPRLQRRMNEVEGFDPTQVRNREDPIIGELESKLEQTIDDLFPPNTLESNRYRYKATRIDTAGYNMNGTPFSEVLEGLVQGKKVVISTIKVIIEHFEEEIGEDEELTRSSRVLSAYKGLDLHPEIHMAASKLYLDGHYASAIEDAVKALNNVVRMRSGLMEDGNKLMTMAFKQNDPILAFNELNGETDKTEQEGYMFMFKGAVSGLRNPRAHRLVSDDPERALEFIAYISLLAKLAESATKRPSEG